MKKGLFLLLLCLPFLIQCSGSDDPAPVDDTSDDTTDDTGGGIDDTTDDSTDDGGNDDGTTFDFGITLGSDYYPADTTGQVYVSDENGAILDEKPLLNGQTASFSLDRTLADQFDVTVLRRINFGDGGIYSVSTYTNVSSADWIFDFNTIDSSDLLLEFENTGCLMELVSSTSGGSGSGTSSGGGSYTFSTSIRPVPGDYYAVVQCPGDAIPRYFWLEDIGADSDITIDFSSLPMAEQLISISIPANDNVILFSDGLKNYQQKPVRHNIELEGNSDETLFEGYVVSGLFDAFYLDARVFNSDGNYSLKQVATSFPSSISAPFFDFQINNTSLDGFSITASGSSYDGFYPVFFFSDPGSDNSIRYTVYSSPEQETISSKSTLIDNIFSGLSAISSGDLSFTDATLVEDSRATTYQELIKLDAELTDELPSGFTRQLRNKNQ